MEREFYRKFNSILLLLSVIFITSCKDAALPTEECVLPGEVTQQEQNQDDGSSENTAPVTPKVCVVPEKDLDANLQINFELTDFNVDEEAKMLKAIDRLIIVVNSVEFKQRVLNHQYNGKITFADNEGLTNEEIYQKIMEGAESLDPVIDQEIDLDVTLYYQNTSTVGYTYPNTNRIWVNKKFFANNSLGKVAANLLHEWTHKIGFGHDHSSTSKRPYSVPYGVGTIIQELVDSMTPESAPTTASL